MATWEYLTVEMDDGGSYKSSEREQMEPDEYHREGYSRPVWKDIDNLGSQGWELVSVVVAPEVNIYIGFFKRRTDGGERA